MARFGNCEDLVPRQHDPRAWKTNMYVCCLQPLVGLLLAIVTIPSCVFPPKDMAPEILEGTPYDHRIDIYSFSLIIFAMWFGRSDPFFNLPGMSIGSANDPGTLTIGNIT